MSLMLNIISLAKIIIDLYSVYHERVLAASSIWNQVQEVVSENGDYKPISRKLPALGAIRRKNELFGTLENYL